MAASAKMKKKKGKTISLTDLLAEDGGTAGGNTYAPKPVSWADETDDLEGDVSTTWHSNDDDLQLTVPSFPLLHGLLGNPISTGAIFPNRHPTLLS